MRQSEVSIGGEYRVRIGDRLAPVTVLRRLDGRGVARYLCRTGDTGREVRATAARLRPLPGTPEAAAERARQVAAQRKRAATSKAPAGPSPDHRPTLTAPSPVPGMVDRVRLDVPVERLVGYNAEMVRRVVAGVHAAQPWSVACRAVYAVIGKGGRLRGFPRHLRRGAWLAVAEEHAANRAQYREVMGHGPIPSEEMITAAMTGDTVARAAVLA
ncbi:MAG: hypothetical protein ACO3DQ_07400 [Cephaloticoccus sp.]